MNHLLFMQLMDSKPSDDDVKELFNDLKYIMEGDFDCKINEAIIQRGCIYIDSSEPTIQ